MKLMLPTRTLSPSPTAERCLCIWERPARTISPRPRQMSWVETTCPTHSALGATVAALLGVVLPGLPL